jgi:hypothetical protein
MSYGLGGLNDILFGKAGKAKKSGAFQHTEEMGGSLGDLLMKRLNTPVQEQERFIQAFGGLKSNVLNSSTALRQRLGDNLVNMNALDSGIAVEQEMSIARQGLQQLNQGYSDLYNMFDQSMTNDAFTYLNMAVGENTNIEGVNAQMQTQARGQNVQAYAATMEAVASMVGGIMGCWVAREVYGPADVRWVFTRYYIWNMGPAWFRKLYQRHGEKFAAWLENKPRVKGLIRRVFDRMWRKAFAQLLRDTDAS